MVAQAELFESEASDCLLAFFDSAEEFGCDRCPVRDARGKAGGGRQGRRREPAPSREPPDLLLAEPRLEKRTLNAEFGQRPPSRPVIGAVVPMRRFENRVEPELFRPLEKEAEEEFLAVVATFRVVAAENRVGDQFRLDHFVSDSKGSAESDGSFPLFLCARFGDDCCGHDVLQPEYVYRFGKKKGRVHASRKCHENAAEGTEPGVERAESFRCGISRGACGSRLFFLAVHAVSSISCLFYRYLAGSPRARVTPARPRSRRSVDRRHPSSIRFRDRWR